MTLLSIFLLTFLPQHDFHVSLAEMSYNETTEAFELSLKIFIDDLEDVIKDHSGTTCNLNTTKEYAKADSLIGNYLIENFILRVDQEKQSVQYLGKEYEDDAAWIYIEIPAQAPKEELRIQNKLLMELYDDQVNILHLNVLNHSESFLMRKEKSEAILTW